MEREKGRYTVNGHKVWYHNYKMHREDGPAVEYVDGSKEWWIDGELVYDRFENQLHNYPNISEAFKKSIIKYRLDTL
jgi:hypothetical protein